LIISSTFLPLIPPFEFTSSTNIFKVLASGAPRKEAGPVTASIAPILMVSAAIAGATSKQTIANINKKDLKILINTSYEF
jgi:hypothetical protein